MVSIIICSRKEEILNSVAESVADTIGIPYEIIAIDNSKSTYGICQAYNKGAAQAKYDVLCFMHEDLEFHTMDWGRRIVGLLSQPDSGVIGVAGSTFQPQAPGGWTAAGSPYLGINVIQPVGKKQSLEYINPAQGPIVRAATLDGMWLCCRKVVWEAIKFDEVTFPGFHFYDIDFCSRVATRYHNYLVLDILIEHFSSGTFDKVWMHNAIVYYKKSIDRLPILTEPLSIAEQRRVSIKSLEVFTSLIIRNRLPVSDIWFCLRKLLQHNPVSRNTFYLVKLAVLQSLAVH